MDRIESELAGALVDGRLPCKRAFALASRLDVPPRRIGEAADRLDVRVSRCQLGLFGVGADDAGRVGPAPQVADALRQAIEGRRVDGELPCAAAWTIAKAFGLAKLDVANAAEALHIRVSHCQLGCF